MPSVWRCVTSNGNEGSLLLLKDLRRSLLFEPSLYRDLNRTVDLVFTETIAPHGTGIDPEAFRRLDLREVELLECISELRIRHGHGDRIGHTAHEHNPVREVPLALQGQSALSLL